MQDKESARRCSEHQPGETITAHATEPCAQTGTSTQADRTDGLLLVYANVEDARGLASATALELAPMAAAADDALLTRAALDANAAATALCDCCEALAIALMVLMGGDA